MEIVPSNYTIAKYCEQLDENAIKVNWKYQRSSEVWPAMAQSFLIESILLGYPVPKLFLYQKTDRISRKTIQEIIDGQQRTVAIKAFYDDELRLSRTLEFEDAAGHFYSELSDELQDRFLSYGLGVDLFVNTTEEEVREVFRRINSYEVPLNPEEQRHARWQGGFKWYIYHLSSRLDKIFTRLGAFSEKQLVRMQDMKLLAEISHAMLHGITTTNKRSLDAIYRQYDDDFPQDDRFSKRIENALTRLDRFEAIHHTPLMRTYSLYSLILAMMHVSHAVSTLNPIVPGGTGIAPRLTCERRLSRLVEAIETGVETGKYARFVRATQKGTNVKAAREIRFATFVQALGKGNSPLFKNA